VKDDALAAAARTLALMRGVGGPLSEKRLGHALGQSTRPLRLKIDPLIDRGVGDDLALQRLESGMVHGGVPSPRQIGGRRRDWNRRAVEKGSSLFRVGSQYLRTPCVMSRQWP
jgi:hypothetical protein